MKTIGCIYTGTLHDRNLTDSLSIGGPDPEVGIVRHPQQLQQHYIIAYQYLTTGSSQKQNLVPLGKTTIQPVRVQTLPCPHLCTSNFR